MVYGIKTIYTRRLNKGFSSRFCVGSQVRNEEGQGTYRLKRCDYNNKDEDNSPNILSKKKKKKNTICQKYSAPSEKQKC